MSTLAAGGELKATAYGIWAWIKFADDFGALGHYENISYKANAGATNTAIDPSLQGQSA